MIEQDPRICKQISSKSKMATSAWRVGCGINMPNGITPFSKLVSLGARKMKTKGILCPKKILSTTINNIFRARHQIPFKCEEGMSKKIFFIITFQKNIAEQLIYLPAHFILPLTCRIIVLYLCCLHLHLCSKNVSYLQMQQKTTIQTYCALHSSHELFQICSKTFIHVIL